MRLGDAIEWHLKKLGKFDGARVETRNDYLETWEVAGVNRPGDDELEAIKKDYSDFLSIDRTNKFKKIKDLKAKLNITDEDVQVLKELLR